MFVLEYQALAGGFLDAQIFAEQALLVRLQVIALRSLFLRWLIGKGTGSPNLTVRMRIAGAHHGATVLENLNVVDEVAASEIGELLAPHSMTATISFWFIPASVRSWRGEKHPTRQTPGSGCETISSFCWICPFTGSGRRAG